MARKKSRTKRGESPSAVRLALAIVFIFGATFVPLGLMAHSASQRVPHDGEELTVYQEAERERQEPPSVKPPMQLELEEKFSFEMTDGYFLIQDRMPVHLMHGPVEPQRIWLGSEYSFWTVLSLREGASNPCSRRDEVPCRFEYRRIPAGTNYAETEFKAGMEFRINSDGWMSFAFDTSVPRKSPLGDVNQVIRVRKGDEVLFVYELPLLIVE